MLVSIPEKPGIFSTGICDNPEAVLALRKEMGDIIEQMFDVTGGN